MKIASCSETLRILYRTKFFPSPDMVAEVHWATKAETFHMKDDEKFLHKEEGVDIVPAWSLAKMIEALPNTVAEYVEDDFESDVEYKLHLCPGGESSLSYVYYADYDGEKLYEFSAQELMDAIFDMILQLNKIGYYENL